MKEYMMQWDARIGGLPWEYRWWAESDSMAIEYAKRHYLRLAKATDDVWGMYVWEDQRLVARLRYKEPDLLPYVNAIEGEVVE